MSNLEALLAPATLARPPWSAVEYAPAFTELTNAAKGKPEQQMGSSVIPAQPPDWRRVEESAAELVKKTQDLRAAVLWARARLHTAGLEGFFEGLSLIRALLERHWDSLYPPLDAEDGNDPSMRINILADLADPEAVLTPLRNAELASARGLGRVCVRELEQSIASPKEPATSGDGKAEPKALSLQEVLGACDRPALEKLAKAASCADADFQAIEAFATQKVGSKSSLVGFPKLGGLLRLVSKVLGECTGAANGGVVAPNSAGGEAPAPTPSESADLSLSSGSIRSRADVVAALDAICAYFDRCEPSSPIPLLLRRSKRLVAKNFIDIIHDLAPDAVSLVEALQGKQD
jgi:type VI secretion system protein ImpA